MIIRPCLAAEAKLDKIKFPVLASEKLDGIRALVVEGELRSRTMKPIPNIFINNTFPPLAGLDGELIIGEPTAHDCYRQTSSGVMSQAGFPDWKFYIFDLWDVRASFAERQEILEKKHFLTTRFIHHKHRWIKNLDELLSFEQEALSRGFEGLILRDPNARYKQGRSTIKEGIMLKLKRFSDAEAFIIGVEELMHNSNTLERDERGYAKRSSAMEGLVPMDTMGALVVKDCISGVVFKIGTGFTEDDRFFFWKNRLQLDGKIVKYKSFKIGVKDAPRHPVYLGIRDDRDFEKKGEAE